MVMEVSKISVKLKNLWASFSDKTYRDDFVSDTIDDSLGVQIYCLREERGWTQHQLATLVGTAQSGICRWEAGDAPRTITSLKKLASAFDVALVVKFVPFSAFLRGDGEPIDQTVPKFDDDHPPVEFQPVRIGAVPTAAGHSRIVDMREDGLGHWVSISNTAVPSHIEEYVIVN